jgi:hypothetical protein
MGFEHLTEEEIATYQKESEQRPDEDIEAHRVRSLELTREYEKLSAGREPQPAPNAYGDFE